MRQNNKHKKVIVAMSGGVDSSVSAALLKKAGFSVTGIFIKCWDASDSFGSSGAKQADCSACEPRDGPSNAPNGTAKPRYACTSGDDERMARLAAAKIGILFYCLNLVKEYKEKVIEYMLNGYKKGITPNPDVMCNKEIKFGLFFQKAMDLGAGYVATGHYAQIEAPGAGRGEYKILAGKDKNKDQSYFLGYINPEKLSKILFPVGGYMKSQVRKLAQDFDLPNAQRPDSQGICFIGKVDFVEFLKQYIAEKQGNIVDTKNNVLGKHPGIWYYTVGQRKGLGLSGGPYFVVYKNLKKNLLIVSKDEADLEKNEVIVRNMNWFLDMSNNLPLNVTARTRYRQTPAPATLQRGENGGYKLVFASPQRAITPGQLAVVYQGDQMIAGGVIQ
ncbi:tRNA 2-thiouridine(34) synthase MnmA [Patescibacteria group bacterium]|nr:tRNA 2-thiouridine(34) synthase MnmA [Patescibacteria group bacterium]